MERSEQMQKNSPGLKCADWEAAALNSQGNPSARSLKEILELQNISLHAPSTDARLHESRGQMHEVDQALARHKEYYAKEEEQFRIKEAQLKDKEAQLQLQLNRFNKFVDTNEEKRRRAEKRAAAEREIIKEKERTIATLKVVVEQMEAKEQKLEAGVKRYKKFEEFLAAVMHVRDEFQEISDIMSRYDLLQSVNGTLVKKEADINRRADRIRSSYQMYKKDAANEVLEKNNAVAALQRELEMCEKDKSSKQGQAEELLSHASEEALYFGQLLLSIDNLFQRCTQQRPNIQHANQLVKRLLRRQVATPETNASFPAPPSGNSFGLSGSPRDPSHPVSASGDCRVDSATMGVAKSSVNVVLAPPGGPSTKILGRQSTAPRPASVSAGSGNERQGTGESSARQAANRQAAPQSLANSGPTLAAGTKSAVALSPMKAEGSSETPRNAGGKRRDSKQAEKGRNAEEQDEQKHLCDDAVQMLGVVAYYMKDFKDICDILTKSRRQQQKAGKTVNVSLGYSRTDDVVEFVTLRDVYAMKGSGGSGGGQGSSDALSSGSSRRFISRMRGQLSAGPTTQLNRTRLNSRSTAVAF
uniref:DUF4200 domain-containing protein n=1 Tax=Neospora caninum (strain Liverpool) TaxID=572307 RepID=A0A0F7U565_NEOCL|nr:TPA: hypothetical protein BN1204_007780 [Neospora caninum Liverpool]